MVDRILRQKPSRTDQSTGKVFAMLVTNQINIISCDKKEHKFECLKQDIFLESEEIMSHSIRKQFAFIFIGLMTGTIMACLIVNNIFLEKYYLKNKQKVLLNAYDKISVASMEGDISSESFDIELRKICGKYNISVIIMDADSRMLKTSGNDVDILGRQLLDNLFNKTEGQRKLLEERDGSFLQIVFDQRTQSEYIEMWGTLENGNIYLMRSALEGIKDSVMIANRFLTYVGFCAVAVSAIIIYLVSKKITEPILELASISEKMTHLDFEAKYSGKSKTELALLGANINELSETLEETISELKTANNELKKDIEKKNKIDEMRKEFLSNVSHELKTPIALIQGYAEGLKEGINDDAESREFYCDVIMDEAVKMNHMVKKLLTLNELEFGNEVVTMERFDIVALIKNYMQSAEILTKQNDISVRMDEYPPVFVWADEFKTEEVFANYFSNAINHCAGERVIDVKLVKGEGYVRVSVFNTGEPIPEESLQHIWEKFYKVDKARTRAYGGSGVGLSIVKAIMDSMNRKYGCRNYDNGVEFWFELETVQ